MAGRGSQSPTLLPALNSMRSPLHLGPDPAEYAGSLLLSLPGAPSERDHTRPQGPAIKTPGEKEPCRQCPQLSQFTCDGSQGLSMTSVPQMGEPGPHGSRRDTLSPLGPSKQLLFPFPWGGHLPLCSQVQSIPSSPLGPLLAESQMSLPASSLPSPPDADGTREGTGRGCPRALPSSRPLPSPLMFKTREHPPC